MKIWINHRFTDQPLKQIYSREFPAPPDSLLRAEELLPGSMLDDVHVTAEGVHFYFKERESE